MVTRGKFRFERIKEQNYFQVYNFKFAGRTTGLLAKLKVKFYCLKLLGRGEGVCAMWPRGDGLGTPGYIQYDCIMTKQVND